VLVILKVYGKAIFSNLKEKELFSELLGKCAKLKMGKNK
jgi:hypothetical protein